MSFGDTYTLGLATSGSKVLNRVNGPNNFVSEYFLQESTAEYSVFIRHTKTKSGLWRHNLEARITTYATDPDDSDEIERFYQVWERSPSSTAVELVDAVSDWNIATANSNLTELQQLSS